MPEKELPPDSYRPCIQAHYGFLLLQVLAPDLNHLFVGFLSCFEGIELWLWHVPFEVEGVIPPLNEAAPVVGLREPEVRTYPRGPGLVLLGEQPPFFFS